MRAQIKAKIPSHQTNEKTDVGEGKEKEGEQIREDDLIRKPVGYLDIITRMSMTIVMVVIKRTLTMMLMADHHRLLELCWSWRRGSSDWGNFKVAYLNIQVKFVVLELGGQGELGEHLLFVLGSRDRQDSAVEGGGGAHLVGGARGSWKVDKE